MFERNVNQMFPGILSSLHKCVFENATIKFEQKRDQHSYVLAEN